MDGHSFYSKTQKAGLSSLVTEILSSAKTSHEMKSSERKRQGRQPDPEKSCLFLSGGPPACCAAYRQAASPYM